VLIAALPASIPSPSEDVWHIGPVPIRAYALAILAGILVAVWIGDRRWIARGGEPGVVGDIAIWAVPFGIVGARVYHVATDWELYFGEGEDPLEALQIWDGGLGVWGAIAFGVLGGWIAVRRRGIPLPPVADALAPGIVIAQGIGRWGNWFNQELFGRPTDVPWALEIDSARRPSGYENFETFHPTFLYESLWCIGVALVLLWADRRFRMGHGRVFALYVALYTAGRAWIESLRIDPANEVFGLRLNVWTSILLGVAAIIYIVVSARLRPGREAPADLRGTVGPAAEPAADAEDAAEPAADAEDAAEPAADADDAAEPVADAEDAAEPVADAEDAAEPAADAEDESRADLSGPSDSSGPRSG
jgi:prolipoprotein diacylglyceryl transferase